MKTRKMKDSGVEWLGSVPEGWQVARVKHVATIQNGSDPLTEGNVPVYGSGGTGFKTCGEFKNGPTVLLGRKGTVDIPHYINGRYWNVDTAFDVSMKSNNSLKWFYFLSCCFDYKSYMSQTTVPSMTQSDYNNMSIPFPPLPEQRAIAAYLDERCAKIDAMVADAKKLIEEYKAWKASVIFEAVTGKVGVDGRCRCRKMRDSGVDWIGQVPEGWVFYPIKRFFSFFKGLNITKADLTESGIPVVSYGQIHAKNNTGTHLQDELLRHVPQHYMESCPESRLKENDFVFADTSEDLEGLGNCAFVDRSDAVMAGYHTIVLRPVKNAHFKYLAYLFRADCWRRQMREIAFGIKVYSLSQRMLRQCSLVLPPLPEQRAIAAYLDRKCAAIDRVVAVKEGLIGDLEAYKKSLIFECVTGKREVA